MNDSSPLARYAREASDVGLGVAVVVAVLHPDMATSVNGPNTSPTASCLEQDVWMLIEYLFPSTITVNMVLAPTLPPLGPVKVNSLPIPNDPEIVPEDDETVTELAAVGEHEHFSHVNLPSWSLVVAEHPPPVILKRMYVGRHWQLPEVISLGFVTMGPAATSAAPSGYAAHCHLSYTHG